MDRILLVLVVANLLVGGKNMYDNYQLQNTLSGQAKLFESLQQGGVGELCDEGDCIPGEMAGIDRYKFYSVDKVIVSLNEKGTERYFVLDLVLQAHHETEDTVLEQSDPVVRNSAVSYLTTLAFSQLRQTPINQLQENLETAIKADFRQKRMNVPFNHILVNKMVVQ